ncbi:HipA domain-containing protein [Nocardioidaceae bacterium]|nr:HipA domain-containing protein [Nocardioidaceae bacterium]
MSTAPGEEPAPAASRMESLKAVERADVYKGDSLAAHLTRTADGRIEFAYATEWVTAGGEPVASTLPVSPDPVVVGGGAVPAFFAGLLPEGRRLAALRRSVKTSADDELSLLLAVGGDTVGDVRVVPSGAGLQTVAPRLDVSHPAELSFRELLRDVGIRVDRVGLPGVQDKVSAAMLNVPVRSAHAQLLLKLDPPEFAHLVENEMFFLRAAGGAGIRTVDARVITDAEGLPGLAVTRFDRVSRTDSPGAIALAVEDGCQALGLPPSEKYRVSTERLLSALCRLCEAPVVAAAEFLAQVAYAFLTGNGDAHAKNFSVMRDLDGRWQPAPAYDLPSSFFYGDHTMALSIDGRSDGDIAGSRFVALGSALGVRPAAAQKILRRVAASADAWVDTLEELPFDEARRRKFARVVRHRQGIMTRF